MYDHKSPISYSFSDHVILWLSFGLELIFILSQSQYVAELLYNIFSKGFKVPYDTYFQVFIVHSPDESFTKPM